MYLSVLNSRKRFRNELFSLEFTTNILMTNTINTAILDISQRNPPKSGTLISNFNIYCHN